MSAHIDLVEPAAKPDRREASREPAAKKREGMPLAKKIVAATGVLVALTALINGGVDLYRAMANVPTSFQERTNEELFKQHFRELPLVSQKVGIKQSDALVNMVLEVYTGGDIFVTYGGNPQWFRAKAAQPLAANLFFISSANAQTAPAQPRQATSALRTVVRPSVVIDLDKVRSQTSPVAINVASPPASTSSTIERAYLVAETRDEHQVSTTAATYTKVFRPEPGYRIVGHEFQLSTANAASVNFINQAPDGQSISISYTIRSGPVYNRWRGWIKGTLQTSQVKIAN